MKYVMTGIALVAACAGVAQAQQKTTTGAVAAADQHFIMEAAQGGKAEVALGQLAVQRASDPKVREFGQRMVQDHGKALDELMTLAQQKNVTMPQALDPKHKATEMKLSKLSGAAFDKAYVQEMVMDHRKDVAEFKSKARDARDPDVKAWVEKTLPTLEEHLSMIQEISGQTGAAGNKTKATTGTKTTGSGTTDSKGTSGTSTTPRY